ncbi:MAG: hypothetical protein N3D11_17865 [Candidatus Sumerlaeia bacterium]|nr:hypothetical protein [Candidatus Sumerlaeia bacterium]
MVALSKIPPILPAFVGGVPCQVRFEYDPGEDSWFNPFKGGGSPGYPPSAEIVSIAFGNDIELPAHVFSEETLNDVEEFLLEQIAELL